MESVKEHSMTGNKSVRARNLKMPLFDQRERILLLLNRDGKSFWFGGQKNMKRIYWIHICEFKKSLGYRFKDEELNDV